MAVPQKRPKQKTLYGRYDDYQPPEGGTGGAHEGSRAVRLVTGTPAPRPGRARAQAPAPDRRTPDRVTETAETAGAVILRVEAAGEGGELLAVALETPEPDGSRLRREVLVAVEQYAALGLHPGGITPEETRALLRAGSLCAAVRKGVELLSYGDASARTLVGKLTRRGIDREVAAEAVAYLADRGLLQENTAALGRASEGARKGWGLRRIRQDLLAHGYPSGSVNAALAALTDPEDPAFVDLEQACVAQVRRRLGPGVLPPTDRAARDKLVSALLRQGYSGEEIREALRTVSMEDGATQKIHK